jgi:hypothetical protein
MIKITAQEFIFAFIISVVLIIGVQTLIQWLFYPKDIFTYLGNKLPEMSVPAWYYNGQGRPIISNKQGLLTMSGATKDDRIQYLLDVKISQSTGAIMTATIHVITTGSIKDVQVDPDDTIMTPLTDISLSLNAYDSFCLVNIYSDGIMLVNNKNELAYCLFDTTDKFHDYRLTLIDNIYTLYIDNDYCATLYDRSNSDGWAKFSGYMHSGQVSVSEWKKVVVDLRGNIHK